MSILVITTGGSIGAEPVPDIKHQERIKIMPQAGRDPVRDVLKKELANFPTRYVAHEHRDSNFIDKAYRDQLAQEIEKAAETAILVTHGTDTLLESAAYFYEAQKNRASLKAKTILLTGAMVPLANGEVSDGYMNLKSALEKLHKGEMQPGVYIVLCDFVDEQKRLGWSPQLYPFAPARYVKFYDELDNRYCRLKVKATN